MSQPSLNARLKAIEARLTELECHAHSGHELGGESLTQIVALVKQDLARSVLALLPSPVDPPTPDEG